MKEYDDFVNIAENYEADSVTMNDILEEFNKQSNILEDAVSKLANGINVISQSVDNSSANVDNVTSNISTLVDRMSTISEKVGENRSIASNLDNEVNRFKKVE